MSLLSGCSGSSHRCYRRWPYGVTAYTAARRTNEIGVCMAPGADRVNVVELVPRGAFVRVLEGLTLGLPLAVGAGRLIAVELCGVSF